MSREASPSSVVARWDDLPLILTADHLATLLHRSAGGIKKAAQEGTLPGPAPFNKKPWVWKRIDWERWYDGKRR